MHMGMHTERIRNAYKHIKGRKERRILLYFFLYCLSFPSSTARVYRQSNFLFASSGMYGYHRAIQITHQASLPVLLGRGRSQFMTNHLAHELYALYALKNRLCILCENTTPKKTAYNAYRNENRRVRRAEGTKMYAYGNAYGTHTKCIQAYKRVKREESLLLLLLYIACLFYLLLPVFTGNHLHCSRFRAFTDPSNLIARSSRSRPPPRSAVGNRQTVIRALYAHSPSVWQTD